MQAAYLDFVTAIVLRKNSITGVLYRDDPTILAWDIANEPSNPGDETGNILQVGPSAKGSHKGTWVFKQLAHQPRLPSQAMLPGAIWCCGSVCCSVE